MKNLLSGRLSHGTGAARERGQSKTRADDHGLSLEARNEKTRKTQKLVGVKPYEPPVIEVFELPEELSLQEWERLFQSPDKPYAAG
ncbi:MAG: hypothetical protein AMXMBFR33_50730 [Candidatus Xenobia bacterium]